MCWDDTCCPQGFCRYACCRKAISTAPRAELVVSNLLPLGQMNLMGGKTQMEKLEAQWRSSEITEKLLKILNEKYAHPDDFDGNNKKKKRNR